MKIGSGFRLRGGKNLLVSEISLSWGADNAIIKEIAKVRRCLGRLLCGSAVRGI